MVPRLRRNAHMTPTNASRRATGSRPPGPGVRDWSRSSSTHMMACMSRRQVSIEEVLSAIEELEAKYGVPSDQRREAIQGELCDSEDLFLWDALVLSRDWMSARTS